MRTPMCRYPKSKEDYTRAQWQIDAHGYWRSSGDRLVSKEELKNVSVDNLQAVYRKYSREKRIRLYGTCKVGKGVRCGW